MFKPFFILSCAILSTAAWSQILTLHDALTSARENRPAVLAARLELDQAKRSARASGSYPATMLGLGYSSRADLGATDQDAYLSQPLDVFGRTSAARERGRASTQVAEASYRRALLEVQADVLTRYFEAATAEVFGQSADELLGLAESLYSATNRRFELGQIPEVQLSRAKIELDMARQATALRLSQRRAAAKRLASAIGSGNGSPQVEVATVLPPLTVTDAAQRPDLLLYAAQARVAEAEANMARRSGMPELELLGLRSPWRGSGVNYGARIQLTVPIFDHGRRRGETGAARKLAASVRAQLEDARRRAQSELEAIEIEREAAAARVASYVAIQQSAKSLVEKSQRGYGEGYGTLIDVLEATRALREIQQQLAEAQLELNLIEVKRYEAAGVLLEELS